MTVSRDDQPDLISDLSDLDFVRHLLADLQDDLPGKVGLFRMLTDLGGQIGRSGTMIFGGHAAYHAWVEARSSFVRRFCGDDPAVSGARGASACRISSRRALGR